MLKPGQGRFWVLLLSSVNMVALIRCRSSILYAAASRTSSAFVPSALRIEGKRALVGSNVGNFGSAATTASIQHRALGSKFFTKHFMSASDPSQQVTEEKTEEEKERLKAEREAKK